MHFVPFDNIMLTENEVVDNSPIYPESHLIDYTEVIKPIMKIIISILSIGFVIKILLKKPTKTKEILSAAGILGSMITAWVL